MGYARARQMVCLSNLTLPSAQAYIIAGMRGQNTRILIRTKQSGYTWMLS